MKKVYHIYYTDYCDDYVKFKKLPNVELPTKSWAKFYLKNNSNKVSGSYYKIVKVYK